MPFNVHQLLDGVKSTAASLAGTDNKLLGEVQNLLNFGERGVSRMFDLVAGSAFDGERNIGRGELVTLINKKLFIMNNQDSPDVTGYTFIVMAPPDLSGLSKSDPKAADAIRQICNDAPFFALDITPPNITINTEEVNTQASVSMPYATAKVATGQLSVTYMDNSRMDVNSLHNVWIEYIYNQLWGDFEPGEEYWNTSMTSNAGSVAGTIDYATSMYILKYDPSLTEPPVMVGKATGIFPLGLPVKETLGTRSARELVMENVTYTCSYYEVIHPRAMIQTFSTTNVSFAGTILEEAYHVINGKFKSNSPIEDALNAGSNLMRTARNVQRTMSDPHSNILVKGLAAIQAGLDVTTYAKVLSSSPLTAGVGSMINNLTGKRISTGLSLNTKKMQKIGTDTSTLATATLNNAAGQNPANALATLSQGSQSMALKLETMKSNLTGKKDAQSMILLNSTNRALRDISSIAGIEGSPNLSASEKVNLISNAITSAGSGMTNANLTLGGLSKSSDAGSSIFNALSSIPSYIMASIPSVSGLVGDAGQAISSAENVLGGLVSGASSALASLGQGIGLIPSAPHEAASTADNVAQSSFFGMTTMTTLLNDGLAAISNISNPNDQLSHLANVLAKASNVSDSVQQVATITPALGIAHDILAASSKDITPGLGSNPDLKGPLEITNLATAQSTAPFHNSNLVLAQSITTAPTITIGATNPPNTGSGVSTMFDNLLVASNNVSSTLSKSA